MARALVDNDRSVADVLRANSEAFFYKLDEMEFHVKKASQAFLQDKEKYILCLETPETSLMSVLLAHSLRKLKKEDFSDVVFTDFHNFIKTNTQQNENCPNFPDILVCKVGVDEQLNQYSEVLTSWARLVKDESKKIIFIMKNSKYLEQSMMKTRMVYVLKLKFTELWEENKTPNNEENKVGNNQENLNTQTINDDVLNNAVLKAVNEAMKNIKAKEKTSEKSLKSARKSALPNEAEIKELTAIFKLHGIESINAVDKQGQGNTPLHLAAKNGQNKIVKVLLVCDAGIETKNYEGHTPLHLATEAGNHKVVSTLLENGANANALNAITARINKEIPLHMACYNNDVRSIELLLKFGANIETKDKNGYTPLHSAIKEGHHKVVRTLLENNANVNAIDNAGQTPLQMASCNNDVRLIELLLKFGAEIETKTVDGSTLLHLAIEKGHHEVVGTLLKNYANVNAINNAGQTPLHMACYQNDVCLIELLMKFGANIETKQPGNGMTPLHIATSSGQITVVTTLLEHGSNINAQDNNGHTPLHHAVQVNNQQLVTNLLQNGADPNLKNNSNQTAVDYARSFGQSYYDYGQPLRATLITIIEKHAASAN